jgi:DNA-binding MarR family transcriptional regulator
LTWTTIFVNTILTACGVSCAGLFEELSTVPVPKRVPNGAKEKPLPQRQINTRREARTTIGLDVLDQHLGYFVRRLQVAIFQDFIRRLARIDVSPAQFSVLVVIDANPGLSQMELANTLGIERARLVRMLHLLEERGLTVRLRANGDGRRHALELTREGQKLLAKAKALAAEHEDMLKEKLGAERHAMLLNAMKAFQD